MWQSALERCPSRMSALRSAVLRLRMALIQLPWCPPDSATALPTNQPGQSTPAVISTPYTPFTAQPSVAGLNLRVQPGHLSEIIRMLEQDAVLTVLGHTPGGQWILVQTTEGISG